jgi:hypothetical protein
VQRHRARHWGFNEVMSFGGRARFVCSEDTDGNEAQMLKNKSKNAGHVKPITYNEFAARHPRELRKVLELVGISAVGPSSATTLAQIVTPRRLPSLPIAMQELKNTSLFRLLTTAGRENCPAAFNVLLYPLQRP